MYRSLVRCSGGRRLLACVIVCLLLTVTLWLRCDDRLSAAATASHHHASSIIGARFFIFDFLYIQHPLLTLFLSIAFSRNSTAGSDVQA